MREPTADECGANVEIAPGRFAIWWPSTGGYVGKAVVEFGEDPDGCVEVLIWHDGEFPFTAESGQSPARLHHCDPEDFIRFGETILKLQERASGDERPEHP